jgi:hypothetical protein
MKKILVLVCFLLIAVAGCTTQPTGNRDVVANANQPAETKSATVAMPSESDIIAKEKGTWDAVKKKDWDAFGNMLAGEYVEVLDNGVHDKAATLTGVKDFDLSEVTYSDWKMIPIDKDAALITYSVTVKAKYKGEDVPPGPYREASAWVNRNGQWLATFYQETAAVTPPPMAPPAEKKGSATPNAAMKASETSSDPIANDKIVWDLFRSRNYDAFAALLAPEFMEVEAFGVYDKAGSVKGVQTFDANDATLSGWKSVKFDDDAAMSVYTIDWKGPQPRKEYHASIWANRSGKWLALLHQGTPAAKSK